MCIEELAVIALHQIDALYQSDVEEVIQPNYHVYYTVLGTALCIYPTEDVPLSSSLTFRTEFMWEL